MHVKKQQLELDMEHQTDSKLGKEYVKAVYCHPACLTFYFFIYFYFEYQEVHGSRIAEAWLGEF